MLMYICLWCFEFVKDDTDDFSKHESLIEDNELGCFDKNIKGI